MGFAPKKTHHHHSPLLSPLLLPPLSLSSFHFCTSLNPERVSDLNFRPRFLFLLSFSFISSSIFAFSQRFPLVFDPSIMGDHLPSSVSPPVADRQPPSAASASYLTRLNSESYSSSITLDGFKDLPAHRCLELDAVKLRLFCLLFVCFFLFLGSVIWVVLGMDELLFADCTLFSL